MRAAGGLPRCGRRALLAAAGLGGLGCGSTILGRPAAGQALPPALLPDSTTLLLPGPENGAAAQWARNVAAGLARALPQAMALRTSILGGPDGVTAANRFATLEGGDGRTLLVLPGLAAHARLVGESRAQFQPANWLPLCASWQGAVLAGRGLPAPASARPLRLALPGPEAPETAALMALDLTGHAATPLFGLSGAAAEAAITRGEADAMVIAAPHPRRRALELGLTPWAELETPERRDSPDLPSLLPPALPATPQQLAVQAGFAALRLRAALVLPGLTSADIVATWRRAALRWQEEEGRQSLEWAGPALVGAELRAAIGTLLPPPEAVLAYREWLLRRLSWQPG